MTTKKSNKERKIFLNCMNSWFSNFVIEEFRTDYIPDAKIKNTFMGTIDLTDHPLPTLFEPKITKVEIGFNYNQEIFENDIFIYNLDDSNLSEVEFVIRGLQTIKYENEKILILISNIMTWAKTPIKTFTEEEQNKEGFNEEEVPEFEEEIKKEEIDKELENENKILENEEQKQSENSLENTDKNKKGDIKGIKDNKEIVSKKSIVKLRTIDKESKKDLIKKIEESKDKENISTIKSNENSEEKIDQTNNNIDEQLLKNEKPKIKTYYYKESEFNKRIPNSKFLYYKILESLALSKINPNLKTYVICPGFIYGCGEDIFFDYFRESWKGKLEYMPIIGEGDNHIPTIHILDLIHTIKRVINLKPDINYIFVCDKTKNPTLRNILNNITKGIGGIETKIIKDFDLNNIHMPHYAELSIDLRIKNSPIMEDEPRKPKEDKEDYEERKFKWHCEFGIPENIELLREEFNLYRDLKPIKIIILGPPYGGKSTIAKAISEKYRLTHYTIDKICESVKNEKSEISDEIMKKDEEIEENINKAMEEYEHRKNKKKTDPPFDPTPYRKYPDDFLAKIIKYKLSSGECLSKGYILENYPKSYDDCLNLFKKENSEENKLELNKEILPDSVLFINNYNDESLKNKLKMKYPDYNERANELDSKFNKRLGKYKQLESKSNENPNLLIDFFKENNLDIYFIDENKLMENKEEENRKIIEYLERNGPIDNEYKLFDEEEIKIIEISKENKENEVKKEEEKEEDNKENSKEEEKKAKTIKEDNNNSKENLDENNINENIENNIEEISNKSDKTNENLEESKNNELEKIQQKINETREREMILLEKKSEILRRYLSENIIPVLSKGILNICQNLPEDPVESLAKYLSEIDINNEKGNKDNNEAENEIIKTINQSISY